MNWLRWLSGPPNVAKLKRNRDVDGLLAALRDESVFARTESAAAFREIPDPRCIEPLLGALDAPEESVRASAAQTLCELAAIVDASTRPRIGTALTPFLENEDLRPAVIRALQRVGAADALATLLDSWSLEDWRTAVQAIRPLGWTPRDATQRVRAAIAMKEWDTVRELGDEVVALLVDDRLSLPKGDPNLVVEGVAALDPLAVAPLIRVIEDASSSRGQHQKAIGLLARCDDARVVPCLVRALNDPLVGRDAADALSRRGWIPSTPEECLRLAEAARDVQALARLGGSAVPALIRITQECSGAVARGAALALGGVGGDAAIAAVAKMLERDRDRDAAVEALASSPDPDAGRRLVAAMVDGPLKWRKAEAAQTMARKGGAALEALVAARENRDEAVRETAATALADAGWAPQGLDAKLAFLSDARRWDDLAALGAVASESLQGAAAHPAPGQRLVVVEAIGRKGGEWARGILVSGLADRVYAVRKAAATGLRALGLDADMGGSLDVKPVPTECAFCGTELVDVGPTPLGLEHAIGKTFATQGAQAADPLLRAARGCECGLPVCYPCFKYGKHPCPDCGRQL